MRRHGGSSALTTFGKQVLATCREIEALAAAAAADRLAWLQARLTPSGGWAQAPHSSAGHMSPRRATSRAMSRRSSAKPAVRSTRASSM